MNTLYADDTYAKSAKSDELPRVHLFGGVVVDGAAEQKIIRILRSVKSRFTHPNMPVKWNFRDSGIQKKYREFNREEEYKKMLAASREWRLEIFHSINHLDYTVVCSCIEAFSAEKGVLSKVKSELNTFCFENVLMRVGMDASERGGRWQCVLDWPPENDSKPLDRGYYQLFHFGRASSPKKAHCGPLEKAGFSHSLLFTRCNHSPMMQIADLVLGATRDHLESVLQARGSTVGGEAVEIFYDHFRNNNGNVPRYGVACSTGSKKLLCVIEKAFKRKANKTVQATATSAAPVRASNAYEPLSRHSCHDNDIRDAAAWP
jgi:hypothetical protein